MTCATKLRFRYLAVGIFAAFLVGRILVRDCAAQALSPFDARQAELVRAAQRGLPRILRPLGGERPAEFDAMPGNGPAGNGRDADRGINGPRVNPNVGQAVNNADDSEQRAYARDYSKHERRVLLLRDWELQSRESGRRYAQSLQRPVTVEQVAQARLRLAKLHVKQGREELGRKWLLDLIARFPESPAAVEGDTLLAVLLR